MSGREGSTVKADDVSGNLKENITWAVGDVSGREIIIINAVKFGDKGRVVRGGTEGSGGPQLRFYY